MNTLGFSKRLPGTAGVQVRRAGHDDDLFQLATQAWERGQIEGMLPELERGLGSSRDYRLWHIHGLMLRELGRREEALVSLRRAVELNPRAAKPAYALAQTLYEAGLPSIDAFGHALRLSPGDPEVVLGLAMAFVGAGEVHTAIDGLEKIVSRSPLWSEGQVMLAQFRWMEGERQGFTRGFDEALAKHPDAVDLRLEQISRLMHAEQWDEVQRVIAEGRAALGELPRFDINEAILLAETGQTTLADEKFKPFEGLEDGPFQLRRVRHFLRSGRPEEAAEIIEPWISRPEAYMFWPYASVAWRQVDVPRWEWLEADERFVGVYDIADRLPPLDALADKLRSLHKLSGQPLEQSLRGGTQTDGDIFMQIDPILVKVREAIRQSVLEHAAQLPPPDPTHPLLSQPRDRVKFAGAWSVWLRTAGYHSNHVHPLGWISSALYVTLPPDIGAGEAGILTLGEPRSTTLDVDMAPFRTVEPKPGRLVLFPSYMWHGTRPFGEGERLTIAFDVARPI